MFDIIDFPTAKILAEKEILLPYIMLLSAAQMEFDTHYNSVKTPLNIQDLKFLFDNAEEAVCQLDELGYIKITGENIIVGRIANNHFITLKEKEPDVKPSGKITGRYVSLLKKASADIIETLIHCNRAFYKKFNFNDTAPLPKQLNALNNIYDTSGLSLKEIYEAYLFFIKHYKRYKLSSPSMSAFNGYFSSVIIDFKNKSYEKKEEVATDAFDNFTGKQ